MLGLRQPAGVHIRSQLTQDLQLPEAAIPTSRSVKKWFWLPFVLLVVGAAVVAIWFRDPAAAKTNLASASAADKPTGVGSRGRIEPRDGVISIAAPYFYGPSIIAELRVQEGDWVTSGQIIGVLEAAASRQAALKESEAHVVVARTRLSQLKAGPKQADIDQQKAEIARWETEYELTAAAEQRYELLRKQELATLHDLQERHLNTERAKRALEGARDRLRSLEAIRSEDIDVLNAELAAAMARVALARADLERVIVRAPAAGRVLKIHAYPGEEIGSQGILELGKTDGMFVVAEVYETDIGRVRVGQKAVISGELLSETLKGVVVRIDPQVSKSELLPLEPAAFADTRVVKVKIEVEKGDSIAGLIYGKVDVVIQP
jgi:HlyD family secretion protein